MRIKKTAQTTTTQAQISDGYSTSKIDGYSCNYVNNALKDVYSTSEVKTNKVFVDDNNKEWPIYRKMYIKDNPSTGGIYIYHNISDLGFVTKAGGWVVQQGSNNNPYRQSIPRSVPGGSNYDLTLGDFDNEKFALQIGTSNTGNYKVTKAYMAIEYTKTTD